MSKLSKVFFSVALFVGCQARRYQEKEYVIEISPTPHAPEVVAIPTEAPRLESSHSLSSEVKTEPVASVSEVEVKKVNPKILLGEVWVQIQFLLDKKNISPEELNLFGLEAKMLNQGVSELDSKIWLPKLEKAKTQLQSFELSSAYIVKRYERILATLLSSNLDHENITLYQDKLQVIMSNLEEKSLPEVNRNLNEIELELKSLIQKP